MSKEVQTIINTINSGTPAEAIELWNQTMESVKTGELSIEDIRCIHKEVGVHLVALVQSPEGRAAVEESSLKYNEQILKKQIDTYGRELTEEELIVSRMIPDMEAWNLGWWSLVRMDREKQKNGGSIPYNRILKSILETAKRLSLNSIQCKGKDT